MKLFYQQVKSVSIIASLLVAMCLPFSTYAVASGFQAEIDDFFKLYQAGKVNLAVDTIYQSNSYVTAIPDQIMQVKNQLNSLNGLMGALHHIDKINDYYVGDKFVHSTYLVIYDRQPLRFEFQFFKVKKQWRIYSFSFDDDLTDDIERLARKAAIELNNQ
ncbi:MAG: hypothetical protein ACSHW0_13825 [Thalassotalea sp.]